ncbi:MAG: hypothetical protein NDI61_13865 [Bdellovibrionaceae bacterium]|nr:hypothetical protein [Pseudobdellovibrionaceae bacterium]
MSNLTTSSPKRLGLIARALLSGFVIYHLLVIVLLPNGSSLEARSIAGALVPYANTLSMNNAWVFFSPGPSPNVYLEYELENEEMESLDDEPRVFPPPKSDRWFSDAYFRSLYVLRYFALDPVKLERFLAPWLCRQHPEAAAIVMRTVFEPVPGIEKAWSGESFQEMQERVDMQRHRVSCERGSEGGNERGEEP